jgi:hypothetical protein
MTEDEYEEVRDLPLVVVYAFMVLICIAILVLLIGLLRFNPSKVNVPPTQSQPEPTR